jgi:hypothetical protein
VHDVPITFLFVLFTLFPSSITPPPQAAPFLLSITLSVVFFFSLSGFAFTKG